MEEKMNESIETRSKKCKILLAPLLIYFIVHFSQNELKRMCNPKVVYDQRKVKKTYCSLESFTSPSFITV